MEELTTLEICYLGTIDTQIDNIIHGQVPNILNEFEQLEYEWQYQESTIQSPHHRTIGYGLSRHLTYKEMIELHLFLQDKFSGKAFFIQE